MSTARGGPGRLARCQAALEESFALRERCFTVEANNGRRTIALLVEEVVRVEAISRLHMYTRRGWLLSSPHHCLPGTNSTFGHESSTPYTWTPSAPSVSKPLSTDWRRTQSLRRDEQPPLSHPYPFFIFSIFSPSQSSIYKAIYQVWLSPPHNLPQFFPLLRESAGAPT